MTIQDLGSIGELVAAVATLATLIYLSLQIRQNSKSNEYTATDRITADVSEFSVLLIENENIKRAFTNYIYKDVSFNDLD